MVVSRWSRAQWGGAVMAALWLVAGGAWMARGFPTEASYRADLRALAEAEWSAAQLGVSRVLVDCAPSDEGSGKRRAFEGCREDTLEVAAEEMEPFEALLAQGEAEIAELLWEEQVQFLAWRLPLWLAPPALLYAWFRIRPRLRRPAAA